MNEAESPELRALNAAVRFRNGLAIALLAYRPARRANMSNIRIGQHLAMRGASYWITFAAHETKQRNAIEFEVPPSLTAAVDRYLKTFRPVLITAPPFCGTAGDAFWVSADGGPLSVQGFYKMIVETTKSGFGESINPHLFRDCAATTVAIDDPGSAAAIAGILGHSSIVTSERHYNQARSIDASRRYQGILAGLRRLTRSQRASAL
jgi:integrase